MSSKEQQPNDAEKNIEIWKVKKLIKRLEAARGNGTSMISLIIRKCAQLGKARPTNCVQRPRIRCRARQRCWLKNL
jgi:peptide subunit release factor 1 (eRF1)